ncbi:MAG: enoyl-CoA hydratase [Bacteriovoracaceae bacterium]|jgi:enoyl-CoA hydratase
MTEYKFIDLTLDKYIATVTLNNPKKANSLNIQMWDEIRSIFLSLNSNKDVRVCIIKSNGKHFTSGIDLNYLKNIMEETKLVEPPAQTEFLHDTIKGMQEAFSAISDCQKPVIAAIHGLCIGAGVDLIAACDIRYSTYNSYFSIMETKLGIVADMGTLQRLPLIIGDGALKEFALTSRIFSGIKAKKIRLVNEYFFTRKRLYKKAFQLAQELTHLPEHSVQGTKKTINFSRDHSVSEGLEYIAKLNSTLLNSPEMEKEMKKLLGMLKK